MWFIEGGKHIKFKEGWNISIFEFITKNRGLNRLLRVLMYEKWDLYKGDEEK